MKANDLVNYLTDFPYTRRSSSEWIIPVSVGLGIALGVGLGVLLAPTSGEQTRQRLREGAERVKERALNAKQKAQSQLQEASGTTTGERERSFANDLGVR